MQVKTVGITAVIALMIATGGIEASANTQQQTPEGAGLQLPPPPPVTLGPSAAHAAAAPATQTNTQTAPGTQNVMAPRTTAQQQQTGASTALPPSLYYLNGPYLVTNGYYNPAFNTGAYNGYNGYNNNTGTTPAPALLPCVAPDPPLPCWPPEGQPHAPLPVP